MWAYWTPLIFPERVIGVEGSKGVLRYELYSPVNDMEPVASKMEPSLLDRLTVAILLAIGVLPFGNASALAAEVPLNMIVSSTGQMRNDGKGVYRNGTDFVGVWLDPSKWPHMSFDFCMNWKFSTPIVPTRTVEHHLTDPVPGGGGMPVGVFKSPYGNDLVITKPMTASVNAFTDMAVGSSVSPDSAEVRFCNSDCTEYYSLIFGAKSVFYRDMEINGAGTTKPLVTRTTATSWTISFPAKTVGRLWKRSGNLADRGLYYYEGQVDLQRQ